MIDVLVVDDDKAICSVIANAIRKNTNARMIPGGHLKFPQSWPGQTPPVRQDRISC